DNLDFQRAVQAYLLGIPPVNQLSNRSAILSMGPANKTVPIWEQLVDSRTVELTANDNTVYTWFWLDLRDGPLVLEVPPKVLGLIDDMWYHWVGDLGITGPDKGRGCKYLLLPPGYKGEVAKGYHVVRCPTYSIWPVWRSFLVDGDPKPGVDLVKKLTKIYPLSQAANPSTPTFVDMSGKPFNMVGPSGYRFWEMLNQVVQEEPTDTVDPTTLGFWASIGIQKGKPFAPDARMKKILTEAVAVANATARAIFWYERDQSEFLYEGSYWKRGFVGGNYQFLRDEGMGGRHLDARVHTFYMATVNTPAMAMKLIGAGSQYAWGYLDANGNALDGSKNYKLNLPKDPPALKFISVVVYDPQTRSELQTGQPYPSKNSVRDEMIKNDDGSIDLYFGPQAPAGKEANWIQTVPGKGWFSLLRLYSPTEAWFDKTWRPGEIEEISD
ncbi:MAG TPA: hypothetical protein DEP47_12240, partial [Chloroflexi bacterium]|nr:hypothetical protein [Chloroflexota bacterium]